MTPMTITMPTATAPTDATSTTPRLGRVYKGTVVHKRLRPKPHALSYEVFSLLLDVDGIDELSRILRIFSRNRFNLFSLYDRDYGPGDGTPVGTHVRTILGQAGFDVSGGRVLLLTYPRVLGYVFNPVNVFYAFDRTDALIALIYEVNNTFGERKSYVVPAGPAEGTTHGQGCNKELFVSPFTSPKGTYAFRVTRPGDDILVGITLRDAGGPLLKTHFRGDALPLDDRTLLRLLARFPLLTFKIMAAIHIEAAKLWWKGVPLVRGHRSPKYSVSIQQTTGQG